MRRLRKNKFIVLIICVTVVSVLYFVAQKAIDEYTFKTNGYITREDFNVNDGFGDREDERRPAQISGLVLWQTKRLIWFLKNLMKV